MDNLFFQGKLIRQFWGKIIRQSTFDEKDLFTNGYLGGGQFSKNLSKIFTFFHYDLKE